MVTVVYARNSLYMCVPWVVYVCTLGWSLLGHLPRSGCCRKPPSLRHRHNAHHRNRADDHNSYTSRCAAAHASYVCICWSKGLRDQQFICDNARTTCEASPVVLCVAVLNRHNRIFLHGREHTDLDPKLHADPDMRSHIVRPSRHGHVSTRCSLCYSSTMHGFHRVGIHSHVHTRSPRPCRSCLNESLVDAAYATPPPACAHTVASMKPW